MQTAITLTGDRTLAFALCQKWMSCQTLQPDQWIVVDDGKVPCEWIDQSSTKPTGRIEYVRREPRPEDPKPTLHINFWTALSLIKGEKILIIVYDEYYAPSYIEEMSRQLDQHEIVGIMKNKYYNMTSCGYCTNDNTRRTSLAETAFRSSFLPEFKEFVKNGISGLASVSPIVRTWLDVLVWKKVNDTTRGFLFVDTEKPLYLGIKGLPGRPGLVGHAGYPYRNFDTSDRKVLKEWIPEHYQIYLDILDGKLTETTWQLYFDKISKRETPDATC